jgi:hypothetical protein
MDVQAKSEALAMTFIEEMEDEQALTDLIATAEDITQRAVDRRDELMPKPETPTWGDKLTVMNNYTGQEFVAGWLRFEKRNRNFPCENDDHDYIVPGYQPRMWVDNGLGYHIRKGKRSQFLCNLCAFTIYSQVPPVPPSIGKEEA